jgi:hypothetical protein
MIQEYAVRSGQPITRTMSAAEYFLISEGKSMRALNPKLHPVQEKTCGQLHRVQCGGMSKTTFRVIGRPVTNRAQRIESNDSLDYPTTLPDGRHVWAGREATSYPGVVGVPAGVLMDAGFRIYEQWLCEVREHRVVRCVVRVLGPAYALEERPQLLPNHEI